MRMSSWTPDIIRFMEDASSYTPYFDALAAVVLRFAGPAARACDAGCGMGQLSFSLAPHVERIDAVDLSPNAISYVRTQVKAKGPRNVRPCAANVASLRLREPYDLMVFNLSASLEHAWNAARGRCRGTLVVINKMHGASCASVERSPSAHDLGRRLRGIGALGIACAGTELDLEFGQPFRSLEDATRYCALFRTRDFPAGPSRADLARLLDETGDARFPYYLPVRRRLALIALDLSAVNAEPSLAALTA